MRLGRGGGEKRRADERGHGTAVFLRSGNELVGQALVLRLGDVARGDGRDTDTGDVLFLDVHAEGKVGGEDDLAARVQTLDICGGVGLGVAELLRLAERGRVIRAGIRHGGKHVIRCAVQNALDSLDLIKLRRAGERGEPGDAAARGGSAAQRHAFFFCKGGELFKVGAHELLVRGDDVLARTHGRAEVAVRRLDAAHDFHHNINRGITHDLVVIGGHGACELRAGTAGENSCNMQIGSPLAQLIKMGTDGAEAQQRNIHGE